jgi:tetratricopeptide (TPR) repeat protein
MVISSGRVRRSARIPPSSASNPPQDQSRSSWDRGLCPALILLLGFLAYAPTLGNGFAFDDGRLVVQNRLITSLRYVPTLLTHEYWTIDPAMTRGGNLYRPLVTISLVLNHAVNGLKPFGYHLVNVLLHAGVSLAVYGLGRRWFLSRAGATVAAAFFAVHPLHTEAVAGIVGRAELLMALGVLLALAGYLRGGGLAYLGSVAAFALGLLSKEQAMVLPALLVLSDLSTRRGAASSSRWPARARDLLPRFLPYLGLLGAYLLLRVWVLGGAVSGSVVRIPSLLDNPLAHASLETRLLSVLMVAGRYLSLFLWPVPLSPDYSYNHLPLATSPLDGRVLLAALLWGSLLALALRSFARGRGRSGVAVLFALIAFFPASNLLVPIGTMMGERLFYLPSAGLCWLAGLTWEAASARLSRPRLHRVAWLGLGALLLALTAQSVHYGRIWRDDLSLFSYAVKAAPESAKVRFNLGNSLRTLPDRREEAVAHLVRATEIYPAYARAWDALGRTYLDTKQWEPAVAALQKAITLEPTFLHIHNNLAVAYMALGRWDDALASLRLAVAIKPDLVQAHRNLAEVYAKKGWTQAAAAEHALALTPADPLVWVQAGTTFLRFHWPEEALSALQEAVRLGPNLLDTQLALAQGYETLGRIPEAAQAYLTLLRTHPNLPAVHRRLADLYMRLGEPAQAEAHRQQAEGILPRPSAP